MSDNHDVELDIFLGKDGKGCSPRLICYSCKQTLIIPIGVHKGDWLNMVNEFKDKHTCYNIRIGWSELIKGGAFWARPER